MRLCVETVGGYILNENFKQAAAFVRLCVETQRGVLRRAFAPAAAFVRLCVETAYGVLESA